MIDKIQATLNNINSHYMTSQEQEQYSFGPWLIEIQSEETLPPQYSKFKDEILSSDLAIKIPINIDRKDIVLGMTLYKEIITLSETQLTIYTADLNKIKKLTLNKQDIIYVVRGGELLCNYIEFATKDKNYRIDYYTVAEEITSKIIRFIRQGFHDSSQKKNMTFPTFIAYDDNLLYRYFLKKELFDDDIKVLAYQPETLIKQHPIDFKIWILNFFKKTKLDEVLFMTNGIELIIASGDIDKKLKSTVDYSYRHSYINLNSLQSYKLYSDDDYMACKKLIFMCGSTSIQYRVTEDFNSQQLRDIIQF